MCMWYFFLSQKLSLLCSESLGGVPKIELLHPILNKSSVCWYAHQSTSAHCSPPSYKCSYRSQSYISVLWSLTWPNLQEMLKKVHFLAALWDWYLRTGISLGAKSAQIRCFGWSQLRRYTPPLQVRRFLPNVAHIDRWKSYQLILSQKTCSRAFGRLGPSTLG